MRLYQRYLDFDMIFAHSAQRAFRRRWSRRILDFRSKINNVANYGNNNSI